MKSVSKWQTLMETILEVHWIWSHNSGKNFLKFPENNFVYYRVECERMAYNAVLGSYNLMPGHKKLYFSTTKYGGRS